MTNKLIAIILAIVFVTSFILIPQSLPIASPQNDQLTIRIRSGKNDNATTPTSPENDEARQETVTTTTTTTITVQVSSSADDCYKGYIISTSSWDWGTNKAWQSVGAYSTTKKQEGGGMRFTAISIPKYGTIVSAYLKLKARESKSGTVVRSLIRGQAADNPSSFSTMSDYDGRIRTGTSVYWDSIPAWTAGTWYTSPDIKTVIQEIVNRAGWNSGNAIVIFWEDHDGRSTQGADRAGYAYDGSSSSAAKLEITYQQEIQLVNDWQLNTPFYNP